MRAAVIGLGMVAETHIRALADLAPTVTLAGVCTRDPSKAATFAETVAPLLGTAPHVYPDAASIAADPDVDFVIICTPPNARQDLVQLFAGAGKHILMEKPIERDSTAAQQIVDVCADAGITLGLVFQHRMRESSQKMTELLARGDLGDIAVAEITIPWWRPQSYYEEPGRGTYARDGGGVLITQAIHTLDLAISLLGPVAKVQAMSRTSALHQMESEDFVTAGLDFTSGVIGSLVASTASFPGTPEGVTVHGTKGSAVLARGQLEVHWRDGRKDVHGAAAGTGGGADPMAFTHDWHAGIIADFAKALQAGGAPIADGEATMHVHRLIDAIVQSSREERAITLSKGA